MAHIERYETQDGKKKYRVRYRLPDGRKRSETFSLRKDAERARRDVERRQELGELYKERPQTFGEFAGLKTNGASVTLAKDGWFTRWQQTVKPSTYDRRLDLRKHLAPLVSLRIDRISVQKIEDVVLSLSDRPRTAKMVHETVTMILTDAKRRGQHVRRDVLELASPRYEVARARRALKYEEVERLAQVSDEPHLIRIAPLTGVRVGELLALREEDVDLDGGSISIGATAYKGHRSDRGAKTAASTRVIPLTSDAITELRRQRELKLRRGIRTSEWAFPAVRGGAWSYPEFARKFKQWREAAGIPDITFHDLRYTFASRMVQAEAHPKVLQALMGHKHFNVTMDIYTKLEERQKREAIEALQRKRDAMRDELQEALETS